MVPVTIISLLVYLYVKKIFFKEKLLEDWLYHPLANLFYSSMSLYFAAMISFPLIFLPSRYIANSSLVLAVTGLFF